MRILALIGLLLALSCNSSLPTAPQEVLKSYSLDSLAYEDVVSGQYSAKLLRWNGQVFLQFGKNSGVGEAPQDVTGVLQVIYANGAVTKDTIIVLSAGSGDFTYTVDSSGVVTFQSAPAVWPFTSGAKLTDSSYAFEGRHCDDSTCVSYVHLAFRFGRVK